MTIEEFFAALEKTPRDWEIEPDLDGSIRRDGAFCRQCPLTAVAGFGERKGFWEYGDPSTWVEAADYLGLRSGDARKIINAADGRGSLRERLLAACGLTLESSSDRKGRGH